MRESAEIKTKLWRKEPQHIRHTHHSGHLVAQNGARRGGVNKPIRLEVRKDTQPSAVRSAAAAADEMSRGAPVWRRWVRVRRVFVARTSSLGWAGQIGPEMGDEIDAKACLFPASDETGV